MNTRALACRQYPPRRLISSYRTAPFESLPHLRNVSNFVFFRPQLKNITGGSGSDSDREAEQVDFRGVLAPTQ